MNTFTGSLQKRGRRYYLVLSAQGKQKWIALKTGDLRLARRRAAQVAPPDALTADDARGVVSALAARYVSAPRLVVFYRRVWRVLGWDAAVWPSGRAFARAAAADGAAVPASEFYRRLETDEVRRVVRYLADGGGMGSCRPTDATSVGRDDPIAPSAAGRGVLDAPASAVALKRDPPVAAAFADMVRIGFCTGLRLSDVAELSRDEVVADGAFLSLQPNKTRHSKRQLLRIPLVGEARECVRRRVAAAEAAGEAFLFPAAARRRPTAGIARAFRACGVLKRGNGRASFHSLRATFISLMDEAGVPPHVTDAITGHAGGGMHARYTQPSDAALAAAVARAIPAL